MKLKNQVYLVTSQGAKKGTGEPYSICSELIKSKTGGEFLSEGGKLFLDEILPVGTRFEVSREILSME